jgi:CDP-6-deoxy-D-xylo-4-hexulose-3-dehydrase
MLKLNESSWGPEEFEAIKSCMEADTFTMGQAVSQFESNFAEWIGSKFAVMVNSGSSANLLAASVLAFLNRGNRSMGTVLVPVLSWSTTYYPWIQNGFNLSFIDISEDSFNLNLSLLEERITPDVTGICVPHILGADAGIQEIMILAEKYNLWVVEDTCESLGASAKDSDIYQKLGTFGDFGTFSFFRSHHISTMEGGMLVTNDFEKYALAKSMRAHGWGRDIPYSKSLGNVSHDRWKDKFTFYVPGYNLRPLEMSGAIGDLQLKKLDSFIAHRKANADYFKQGIENIPQLILQNQGEGGSWMAFAFLLKNGDSKKRAGLVKLLESQGVETRPIIAGNFHQQPVMAHLRAKSVLNKNYPIAEKIDASGIMIANHGRDLTLELDFVLSLIGNYFEKN